LIGALPTYARVGVWAPVLLCLLRLLQGVSTGGEFVGSITFLVEQAPPGRRALYGSLANAGAILGGLLGAGAAWAMAAAVSADAMRDWGWRVPFLSGLIVGLCGLWIRLGVPESPTYRALAETGAVASRPVRTALRWHLRDIALTLGLNWVASAGYYIVFVWYVTDLTTIIHLAYPSAS
jgi:MHS family proline/betaine transporter-like MFS transporter